MSRRLFVAALGVAALAATGQALGAGSGPKISGVDMNAYPRVRVAVVTPKPSQLPPTLTENNRPAVGQQAVNLGRDKSIVLAVDRSQSMIGEPLHQAVAAARAFVAAKQVTDRIAVTTFATKPVLLAPFSAINSDADDALKSIRVDPVSGTTLYDDIVLAANSLADESQPGRVIIVVTDGNETRSAATLDKAIQVARDAGAAVYVVAIESKRFTPAPLKQLASQTGGQYYGAASTKQLKTIYAGLQRDLNRTWQIEYLTAARPGDRPKIVASFGGVKSPVTQALVPKSKAAPKHKPLLPESAYGAAGIAGIACIVGLLVLLAYAFIFASRKADRVRNRVEPHIAKTPKKKRERKQKRDRLEALHGIFIVTERVFGGTRIWKRLHTLIDRADLPLKTAELVYMMVGAGFLLGMFFAIVSSSTILILLAFVVGTMLPFGFVSFKAKKRLNAFENQLPDILISMAASLKAGHSFKSGLQAAVDEGYEPAGKEFKRVLTETRLGRPMDDALKEMAERIGSSNLSFIVTAVSVQSQVGGSLAGLFDMVADTVRNRQQFSRKIKALTAMGRMSGYVLCGLPFLVAGGLTLINPGYMAPLFQTPAGHKLLLIGLVMMAFGSFMLKRIVSFKG